MIQFPPLSAALPALREPDHCANVLVKPYRLKGNNVYGGIVSCQAPESGRIKRYNGNFLDIYSELQDLPEAEELKGNYLFGGPLYPHFGHVLTESIHRLYAFDPTRHDGVVYLAMGFEGREESVSRAYLPGYLTQILDLYGIDSASVKLIKVPTNIQRLEIYEPGSTLMNGPHAWYKSVLGLLEERMYYKYKLESYKQEKIFMPRIHLKNRQGTLIGESYISGNLSSKGFDVFLPERFNVVQQALILKSAREIVFVEGSGIYSCELLKELRGNVHMIPRRTSDHAFSPHLQCKSNFATLGDLKALALLRGLSDHIGPHSPAVCLRPSKLVGDLGLRLGHTKIEFDNSKFEDCENCDAILYAGASVVDQNIIGSQLLEARSFRDSYRQ